MIRDDFDLDFSSYKAIAALNQFPRGDLISYDASESFSSGELPIEVSIPVQLPEPVPTDSRLHYSLYIGDGEKEFAEMSAENISFLFETDPFVKLSGQNRIARKEHPEGLEPIHVEGFIRKDIEGAYPIEVAGTTNGHSWTAPLFVYKASYINGINRSRGRSRPEYVTYEVTEGLGGELATILADTAESLDFIDKRQKTEFVIDFVQRLPYVSDDVSKGFDDYTKFIIETLAEGNGDCEDTAIMLASVLESQPFNYDMVLIQPPGHMAAGIWGSDLTGRYYEQEGRKYYYIETTGEGWGIGDEPADYLDETAYIHQV